MTVSACDLISFAPSGVPEKYSNLFHGIPCAVLLRAAIIQGGPGLGHSNRALPLVIPFHR